MILPLLLGGALVFAFVSAGGEEQGGGRRTTGGGEPPPKIPEQTQDTDRALWDVFCSQSEGRTIIPARRTLAKAALTVVAPDRDWPPGLRGSASEKALWSHTMDLAATFRSQAKAQGTTCPMFPSDMPSGGGTTPGGTEPGTTEPVFPGVEPSEDKSETLTYRGFGIELTPGGAGWLYKVYDNQLTVILEGSKPSKTEALDVARDYIDSISPEPGGTEPEVEPEIEEPLEEPEIEEPLSPVERVELLQALTRPVPTPGFFYQITGSDSGGMSGVANRALGASESGAQRKQYIKCIAASPINVTTGASNLGTSDDSYAGQARDGRWYKPGGFSPRYENAQTAAVEGRWWGEGGGRFALIYLPPVELAGTTIVCERDYVPPELLDELGPLAI